MFETAIKESESGQERLQRTKERIDFRTAQAVDDISANDAGADVVATGSDDIKVVAESTDLSRDLVQLDAQMEMVQLEV